MEYSSYVLWATVAKKEELGELGYTKLSNP